MKLKSIFLVIFASVSTLACAESTSQPEFSLDNTSDRCVVHIEEKTLQLKLTSPCSIVESSSGKPENQNYDGFGRVYMVTGKPASAEYIKKWNVDLKMRCSSAAQHLIIGETTFAAKEIMRGGLFCPTKGLDEIFYRTVFKKI